MLANPATSGGSSEASAVNPQPRQTGRKCAGVWLAAPARGITPPSTATA
jgi:hypothetical protein